MDIHALAARIAARAPAADAASAFVPADWDDMHASGYLRRVIPRAYGGEGAAVLEMVQAQEILGAASASTALGAGMLISVLGRVRELQCWPEPVFAEICRELASEGGGINNCVTETELGSISRGGTPLTQAEPVPGGYRVSGHKIFVTAAPALRFLVTGLVLAGGEMASAIVRAPSPGLRIEPTWHGSLALRSAGNDDVIYDQVFVPDAWVVERRPAGAPPKPGPVNPWQLPIAAVYLGVAQSALDAACDYAHARAPNSLTGTIAGQPHIQAMLGEMSIAITAARAVLYDAARQPEAARLAVAKYLCTNAACRVTELGLRVAGGFGLTPALPFERLFRDARAGLFAPPQDDLALGIAGRAALAARPPPLQRAAE